MSKRLPRHHVVTFYQFVEIVDPESVRDNIAQRLGTSGCQGTILIAEEGVNAAIAHADRATLERAVGLIQQEVNVDSLECKWSTGVPASEVFHRFKIRVRKQIVTFDGSLKKDDIRGEFVSPSAWNELLDDENVSVVDIRNSYETEIGKFEGAIDLNVENFRDLPKALAETIPPACTKAVAIYCTGGIRCEKASRWMIDYGYSKVYQLRGGILGYLENVNPEERRWNGECFVFDQRVALTPDLDQGKYTMCHACRRPLSPEQKESGLYQEGVSCPKCAGKTSGAQRQGFKERVKQVRLAEQKGISHIGPLNRIP